MNRFDTSFGPATLNRTHRIMGEDYIDVPATLDDIAELEVDGDEDIFGDIVSSPGGNIHKRNGSTPTRGDSWDDEF